MDLAFGQGDFQRIAQSIDNNMDLRRQAATRTAYGLVAAVFF
jgi:hypothetical protein